MKASKPYAEITINGIRLIVPSTRKIPIGKHNSFLKSLRLFVNTDNTNCAAIKYSYLESSGRFNAAFKLRPKNFFSLVKSIEELGFRNDMARVALYKTSFKLGKAVEMLMNNGGNISVSCRKITKIDAAPNYETHLDRPMKKLLFKPR